MKLLKIDSSPFGEAAISRRLTGRYAEMWLAANPDGQVTARDLTAIAIPSVDAAWVAANYTPRESRTQAQHEMLQLSAEFIRELADADEYVIGMPVHNWGPPARVKLWVDQIVTPTSLAEKLLAGKKATVLIAAGRVYAPGSPDAPRNFLASWLRAVFGSLGMSEMQFVMADGTRDVHSGAVERSMFLAPHIEAIHDLLSRSAAVDANV